MYDVALENDIQNRIYSNYITLKIASVLTLQMKSISYFFLFTKRGEE